MKKTLILILFFILTASVFATEIEITAGQNSYNDIGSTAAWDQMTAQSFNVSDAGSWTIDSVSVAFQKVSSPGDDVVISLVNDTGGTPDLTAVLQNASITSGTITTSMVHHTVAFASPVSVEANVTMWLVFQRSGAVDGINYNRIGKNSLTDDYATGEAKKDGSSSSWPSQSYDYTINVTYNSGVPQFQITAEDDYNSSALNDYNVTLTNSTDILNYTTSTGNVTLFNMEGLYNISFFSNNYDQKDYTDYNSSADLEGQLSYIYYRVNITANSSLNSSAIYNFTVDYTSLDSSDTGQVNTTDSQAELELNKNENYTFTISKNNFATSNNNETITNNSLYSYILYPSNSLQIYVYDELTGVLMAQNVSLEFIGINGTNYTIENGDKLIQNVTSSNYTLRFNSSGYEERFYYITIEDLQYYEIALYLLDDGNSSNCIGTVYDENSDEIEGVTIKMLKYFPDCGCYSIVDMVETNFEGQGVLSCELNTEFYKFIIEYNDQQYLETNPSYIFDTSLTFQINLQGTIGDNFYNVNGVLYNLTFNEATNSFRYTWDNPANYVLQGCLNVYRITSIATTLVNSSCTSSAAATILLSVSNITGRTYKAVSSIYFETNEEYYLETLYKKFSDSLNTFGDSGLFYLLLIEILFLLMGSWNPQISMILMGVAPILFDLLGLTNLGTTITVSILGLMGVIAYIISDRS